MDRFCGICGARRQMEFDSILETCTKCNKAPFISSYEMKSTAVLRDLRPYRGEQQAIERLKKRRTQSTSSEIVSVSPSKFSTSSTQSLWLWCDDDIDRALSQIAYADSDNADEKERREEEQKIRETK
ncbi:uncharacterized protein LOC116175384 [Photinus pyralis]|uniref:uncharacterized protein LOC116175384 n=1 Tax=Photinus pyralis TaxID=7054 RepID=UPI0012677B2A|nr:uncharacterized protein LOC116175384 [Photinus pyralis]